MCLTLLRLPGLGKRNLRRDSILFCFSRLNLLLVNVSVCVCVGACMCTEARGIGFPEAGVTGGREPP